MLVGTMMDNNPPSSLVGAETIGDKERRATIVGCLAGLSEALPLGVARLVADYARPLLVHVVLAHSPGPISARSVKNYPLLRLMVCQSADDALRLADADKLSLRKIWNADLNAQLHRERTARVGTAPTATIGIGARVVMYPWTCAPFYRHLQCESGDYVSVVASAQFKAKDRGVMIATQHAVHALKEEASDAAACATATREELAHEGFSCDGCGARSFVGLRFRCTVCTDFDLCEKCYDASKSDEMQAASPHSVTHRMLRMRLVCTTTTTTCATDSLTCFYSNTVVSTAGGVKLEPIDDAAALHVLDRLRIPFAATMVVQAIFPSDAVRMSTAF